MIKFYQIKQNHVDEVVNDIDNSLVHDWFKGWIVSGFEKHPKQDISQSSFQRYLNKMEDVNVSAYEILKKYKETKKYSILKFIKIVAPVDKSAPKVSYSDDSEEVDVSDVVYQELPKIVTDSQPQRLVSYNSNDVTSREGTKKGVKVKALVLFSCVSLVAVVICIFHLLSK